MHKDDLRDVLTGVAAGSLSIEDAESRIAAAPFTDIGFAAIDTHRGVRDGLPEVILAMGKTPAQVKAIAARIAAHSGRLLVTRVEPAHLEALRTVLPAIEHDEDGRVAWYDPRPAGRVGGVAVVTAGTADIPVAQEAAFTAELMGAQVERYFDLGVAGIHRITARAAELRKANAVVVCAGMEGALPSVVAGMLENPVIAVPTSVGYGAAFNGLAALLGMLNSCATGVSVVNIDNGFGAGYLAATINRQVVQAAGRRRGSRAFA